MGKHLVYYDADRGEIRMVAAHSVVRVYKDDDGNYTVELGGRCAPETVYVLDACWLEQNSYGHVSLEPVD